MSNVVTAILGSIVEIVTYVLMAFSIVSLVISSFLHSLQQRKNLPLHLDLKH